jgi:HSP20 family protein
MALVRWDPTREVASLQGEMNRLFSSFFDMPGDGGGSNVRRWVPAMDLVETGDGFVLRADLPGMSEDDVHIEVENDILTISGERKSEHEDKKEGYYRLERASGFFSRSLTLPEGVDPEQVEASFERGVLTVRIPKPAQTKPQKVRIGVGGRGPQTIDAEASTGSTEQASTPTGGRSTARPEGQDD